MNEKLIIDNHTDKPLYYVMQHVQKVLERGRVSGESYCYLTSFTDDVYVSARRNKASDTFMVWQESEQSS